MKKVIAFIFFMAFVLMFMLGACTQQTCPTYANTDFVAPIEQQPDTTVHKPTVIEKTGMVLFTMLVIHQVTKQQ